MSKTHFQFNLCKLQVPLKELVETIINTNFLKLRSRNCVIKSLVNKEQKKKGKSQSFNFLRTLTQNGYFYQNETTGYTGKYINTNTRMWMFGYLSSQGKQITVNFIKSTLAFPKTNLSSSVANSSLGSLLCRNTLTINSFPITYGFQTHAHTVRNNFLKPNSEACINNVTKRFYSRCRKKRKFNRLCRACPTKSESCDSEPLNPKLQHYRDNKDKYPVLCKYCKRCPYKRRKTFYEWLCSLIGCKRKRDRFRCCRHRCALEVKQSTEKSYNTAKKNVFQSWFRPSGSAKWENAECEKCFGDDRSVFSSSCKSKTSRHMSTQYPKKYNGNNRSCKSKATRKISTQCPKKCGSQRTPVNRCGKQPMDCYNKSKESEPKYLYERGTQDEFMDDELLLCQKNKIPPCIEQASCSDMIPSCKGQIPACFEEMIPPDVLKGNEPVPACPKRCQRRKKMVKCQSNCFSKNRSSDCPIPCIEKLIPCIKQTVPPCIEQSMSSCIEQTYPPTIDQPIEKDECNDLPKSGRRNGMRNSRKMRSR